jgi:RNA polymerase sigma-70 factor (ECF subfamily)
MVQALIERRVQRRPQDGQPRAAHANFPTTSWSLVRRTGFSPEEARRALAELCRAYRRPVYYYYRGLGQTPDRAEDLVQGLFARLLAHDDFSKVGQDRRFRHWLCTCARHFWLNQLAYERRQRRWPVDFQAFTAEQCLALEPREELTQDRSFDRFFALSVIERALDRQRADYAAKGTLVRIAELRAILSDADPAERPQSGIRRRSNGAARSQRWRARARIEADFRRCLRRELFATGVPFAEIDAEIRTLMEALEDGRP